MLGPLRALFVWCTLRGPHVRCWRFHVKQLIVCVYDAGTESYGQPVAVPHATVALRSFQQETANPESQLSKHPSDFELRIVGEFDLSTGELVGHAAQRLARASDFVKDES